jgi:proteasome lid subunit RPN8/RPN11
MKPLLLSEAATSALEAAAIQGFPEECCGFMLGHSDAAGTWVHRIVPATNAAPEADRTRRFAIHPREYIAAEREALSSGQQLCGIYHSHPSFPAVPSLRDLAVAQTDFSYVIVSCYPTGVDHVRSWRLDPQRPTFREEPLILKHLH